MENPKIIVKQLEYAKKHPDTNVIIYPPLQSLNEIHFSVRGPLSTIFEGGWYHGCILLPKEYPYRPPHVRMLTRSGRFEINTNICFSYTAFHPETWSPAINFNVIIIALQSLFDAFDERAVGMISSIDKFEIKKYLKCSQSYKCDQCNANHYYDIQKINYNYQNNK